MEFVEVGSFGCFFVKGVCCGKVNKSKGVFSSFCERIEGYLVDVAEACMKMHVGRVETFCKWQGFFVIFQCFIVFSQLEKALCAGVQIDGLLLGGIDGQGGNALLETFCCFLILLLLVIAETEIGGEAWVEPVVLPQFLECEDALVVFSSLIVFYGFAKKHAGLLTTVACTHGQGKRKEEHQQLVKELPYIGAMPVVMMPPSAVEAQNVEVHHHCAFSPQFGRVAKLLLQALELEYKLLLVFIGLKFCQHVGIWWCRGLHSVCWRGEGRGKCNVGKSQSESLLCTLHLAFTLHIGSYGKQYIYHP